MNTPPVKSVPNDGAAVRLLRYKQQGFSFFNTACAEKKVLTPWTQFTTRKPTDTEVSAWLQSRIQNYGIVCGEISGIVVFDCDIRNGGVAAPFLDVETLTVKTPSGGYHFYFKYEPMLAKTKHRNKSESDALLHGYDVQSNGSLVFAPPTQHTGREPYTILKDVPVATLPNELRMRVLSILDPVKDNAIQYTRYTPPTTDTTMMRPGDKLNTLYSWDAILNYVGFKKIGERGGTGYWHKPNKKDAHDAPSVSTNHNNTNLLFCFTSSIQGLEPMRGYSKYGFYINCCCGGDAVKALKTVQGFMDKISGL